MTSPDRSGIYASAPGGTKVPLDTILKFGLKPLPIRDFPLVTKRLKSLSVAFEGSKEALDAFMRETTRLRRLGRLRAQAKRKGRPGWKHIA